MKKATMIILALVLCCSFVFAADASEKNLHEGIWLGAEYTLFHQGAGMIIDNGKYDVEVSLTAPLMGLIDSDGIDWYQTMLSPKLYAELAYSVINTDVFTWNFGIGATGSFYTYHNAPDAEHPDVEEGTGSSAMIYANASTTFKFNIGNSCLFYLTGRYPIPLGGGITIGPNASNANAGFLIGATLFSLIYDNIDVGLLFRI